MGIFDIHLAFVVLPISLCVITLGVIGIDSLRQPVADPSR